MRVAAIDQGTNTTRLLVADIEDGDAREVHRETRITRLGEGVDTRGRLLPVPIARVRNALSDYRRTAEALGAERLGRAAVVGERVADARDRDGEEAAARVDALAEPRDARLAMELARDAVLDIGDEKACRVRPLVDRRDSHRSTRTQPSCASTLVMAARRMAS